MNISSFLFPKKDVAYIHSSSTLRQALEKLENHYYTAIPIIDSEGKYAGTLTEGDILWKMKNTAGLDFDHMHKVSIIEIKQHVRNHPVSINAHMEDMLALAADQNFVPVIDDEGIFIGIIRRKDVIEYYMKNITD
ncbi:MAG TPA: CBS domain-containing protein [Bacilli bacterium]